MKLPQEAEMIQDRNLVYMWKIKPSENEGYYRTYYTTTPEGDQIEVDFNNVRNMVRLSLKLEREHGREYVAIIKSGTIIRERDVSSSRTVDLTSRIYPLRHYFGYLREEPILRNIGGNYEIPESPLDINLPRLKLKSFQIKRLGIFTRLRAYLRKRREWENAPAPWYVKLARRLPAEMLDLSLGGLLYLSFVLNLIGLTEFAGFAGFLGVMTGAIDWVWRQRNPFLPKVILFMALGSFAILRQIQYNMWSIWL